MAECRAMRSTLESVASGILSMGRAAERSDTESSDDVTVEKLQVSLPGRPPVPLARPETRERTCSFGRAAACPRSRDDCALFRGGANLCYDLGEERSSTPAETPGTHAGCQAAPFAEWTPIKFCHGCSYWLSLTLAVLDVAHV